MKIDIIKKVRKATEREIFTKSFLMVSKGLKMASFYTTYFVLSVFNLNITNGRIWIGKLILSKAKIILTNFSRCLSLHERPR